MRSMAEGHSGAESLPSPSPSATGRIESPPPRAVPAPINPAFTLFVAPGNRFVAGMQV